MKIVIGIIEYELAGGFHYIRSFSGDHEISIEAMKHSGGVLEKALLKHSPLWGKGLVGFLAMGAIDASGIVQRVSFLVDGDPYPAPSELGLPDLLFGVIDVEAVRRPANPKAQH